MMTGGNPDAEFADIITLPWNRLDLLQEVFAQQGEQIAAVICEPINGNSGCIMPVEGYLEGIVALCTEHGAKSIFDEVITGFRIALGGAREYFGVIPDLSTYAKAIAGGFSVSAVAGRREMFDCIRAGTASHSGTYNGQAVNIAASLAVVNTLRQDGMYEAAMAHGDALRAGLLAAAARHGVTLSIAGVGTMFSLHWGLATAPTTYRESLEADSAFDRRFCAAMLERGVSLVPGRWFVGMAHGEEELAYALAAIEASLAAIAAE